MGRVVNVSFEPYAKAKAAPADARSGNAAAYDGGAGTLRIENASGEDFEAVWRDYLDLGLDYGAVKRGLAAKDPVIADAIRAGEGIRILKQDEWETLVSFIISQNNNIPRIKKCVESLCDLMGEPVGELRGRRFSSLPGWERLAEASEADLAPCRLGYRAKYLIETARSVAEDGARKLYAAKDAELGEAREYLLSLCGVGPKVANCILLFSMRKHESFPIDVWVRRVMSALYGMPENDMKAMAAFAEAHFGEWGGIAQQYLFRYVTKSGVLK
jgi:N-glycosylase/DNA lyase